MGVRGILEEEVRFSRKFWTFGGKEILSFMGYSNCFARAAVMGVEEAKMDETSQIYIKYLIYMYILEVCIPEHFSSALLRVGVSTSLRHIAVRGYY